MNKFELFTLIFYALDVYYDNSPSEQLGQFLSEMCPFTFKQVCSADPAVYSEFCDFIGKRKITIDNSYEIAMEYINSFTDIGLRAAFKEMNNEKWIVGCGKYLAADHKGMDLDE